MEYNLDCLVSEETNQRKKSFSENRLRLEKKLSELKDKKDKKKRSFISLESDISFIEKDIYNKNKGFKLAETLNTAGFALFIYFGLPSIALYLWKGWKFFLYYFLFQSIFALIDILDLTGKTINYFRLKKELAQINDEIDTLSSQLRDLIKKEIEKRGIDLRTVIDQNADGTIDAIEHNNEFYQLLKKHQAKLIETERNENRNFLQQFVQLAKYIDDKTKNLQNLYERLPDFVETKSFDLFQEYLLAQIHFYNLVHLNAIAMITSFIEDDRITFYKIYDFFDSEEVFYTHYEKRSQGLLMSINAGISVLIEEIRTLNAGISNLNDSIDNLISITEESVSVMNSINHQLEEIDSNISAGNTINAINAYQNYKTRKMLN